MERLEGRRTELYLEERNGKLVLYQGRFPVVEADPKEWEVVKRKYREFVPDVVYLPTGERFCKLFVKDQRVYILSESGTVLSVPEKVFEQKFGKGGVVVEEKASGFRLRNSQERVWEQLSA